MTKEQYDKLDARIANIEQTLKEFMDRWGPDVQEKRDKRDRVWDEMVRVVSLQDKHKGK